MTRIPLLVATAAVLALAGCKKQTPIEEMARIDGPGPVRTDTPKAVQDMIENFQRVHFAFDSSALTEESKRVLAKNVSIMQKHAAIGIEVQGHCDERGTIEYNLALGQRRADAVRKYMISQGVPKDRVQMISYGKERPLQNASTETAWAQNRRAEFRISWGGDGSVGGTL